MTPGRFARAFSAFLTALLLLSTGPCLVTAQVPRSPHNDAIRRTNVTATENLYRRTVPIRSLSGLQFHVGPRGKADTKPPSTQIDTWDDEEGSKLSERYYAEVARVLGFGTADRISSLDALLGLCGYDGLSAADVERLEPHVLMDPAQLSAAVRDPERFKAATANSPLQSGDILVTRFFSPKTTDVSRKVEPVAYSWRKLVRLRARPGSLGATRGANDLWILTVRYEPDLSKNPFEPDATPAAPATSYFQAIVTRTADADWPWPLCWFAFGPASEGAKRQNYSETSWDAADPRLVTGVSRKYYIPVSCVQCHGRDTRGAKLQYLDSDHWIDRAQEGDDFAAVGHSPWPALFDEGSQPTPADRKRVYDVLRQLNADILKQNQLADAAALTAGVHAEDVYEFQTRAAANWVRLHRQHDSHISPHLRGIPSADGKTIWNPEDPTVRKLLPLLNRYCFRCHSSVAYHVFDKSSVLQDDRIGLMIGFLQADGYESMRMPQDRVLSDDHPDHKRLIELLEKVRASESME